MADVPAASAEPAIRVEELVVRFGPLRAVDGVSFHVAPGECLALVGESGCGKTSALRALAGLNRNWDGTVSLLGEPARAERSARHRRQVQMVFQDPYGSLHPRQTVSRILSEPLAIHRLDKPWQRAAEALANVQLPPDFLHRYPNQMSGGQRQRVAIARALITQPAILLLDEPTSALDVSVQDEILTLLDGLRRTLGLTYVFVSHDLAVVARICDRVAVMQHGRIVEELTPPKLRRRQVAHPYTADLLQATECIASSGSAATPGGRSVLDVRGLHMSIRTPGGVVEAVRGIDFSVNSDRLGIVGESGSGKSMTGRALLGLPPPGGTVRAERMTLGELNLGTMDQAGFAAVRGRRIGMVLQDPKFSLNPVLRIGHQMDEVSRLHRGCSAREARRHSAEMLLSVGIRDPERVCALYPHEVSGGMGQRIMIGLMLAADPDLLVADEATSALDVRTQVQVLGILDRLVAKRQMGLILISHDLRLVRTFCDRVAVMQHGVIVEQGPVSLLADPQHPYTRRLVAVSPTLGVSESGSQAIAHLVSEPVG